MSIYEYRAQKPSGHIISGTLEAASEASVIYKLSAMGLIPVLVQELRTAMAISEWIQAHLGWGLPEPQELIIFSRQMQTLVKAGVPLLKSLSVVLESSRHPLLKKALTGVMERVSSGHSLASAMNQYPLVFSRIMVAMVQVGESTGALEDGFTQIAFYLETEHETKKRIKSATRYPTFILSFIGVAVAVINMMVVPAFKSFFKQFGAQLPLSTRILIASSDFTLAYWPWLLVALLSAVGGAMAYTRSEVGGLIWDRWLLRAPIMGSILEKALLARFSRAFAMTTKSGVPLLEALVVIANAVGNRYVTRAIMQMRSGLERGEPLLQVAQKSGLFTPLVLQMLGIGEETGDIEVMLTQVAGYYESEVDYELKRLADVIEPVLIVMVAGVVLILALGVFLPMWDLSGVVLKKVHH